MPISSSTFFTKVKNRLRQILDRKPQISTLKVPGIEKHLLIQTQRREDTVISAAIRREGVWEPDESALIKNMLRPGQTFVDVGANLGYFTLLAASITGDSGRVIAFEPEPGNYELLKANILLNKFENVDCFPCALSDRDGTSSLYLNETNLGDHQMFPGQDELDRAHITIDVSKGDDVLFAIPRVDFIKIDTQGSEYHVLMGLQETIKRSLPHLSLILEYTPSALNFASVAPMEMLDNLSQLGFRYHLIRGSNLVPITEQSLGRWTRIALADTGCDSFINLLCTHPENPVPLGWQDIPVSGQDALDVLFGDPLHVWAGEQRGHSDIGIYLYMRDGWNMELGMTSRSASLLFKPQEIEGDKDVEVTLKGISESNKVECEISVNGQSCGDHDICDCSFRVSREQFFSGSTIITFTRKSTTSSEDYTFQNIAWKTISGRITPE